MSLEVNQNDLYDAEMSQAKNGEVFDSSRESQPFEFTLGRGEIIPGFEKGIIGMEVGEAKTIKVPPGEAYGPRTKELVAKIRKVDLPEQISPAIGLQLRLQTPDGRHIDLLITNIDEDTLTLDGKHPLAGNTLAFNVELVEIV